LTEITKANQVQLAEQFAQWSSVSMLHS